MRLSDKKVLSEAAGCNLQEPPGCAKLHQSLHTLAERPGGFTLIELVLVISLMSLLLFFSIPRFQTTVLTDNNRKVSLWIMGQVQQLKDRSVRDQKRYALHIELDEGSFWTSDESMDEERLQTSKTKAYKLPDDVKVQDVEYAGKEKVSGGRADIFFYPRGYSDRALIHLRDDDNNQRSFVIEPFLSRVKIVKEYISF